MSVDPVPAVPKATWSYPTSVRFGAGRISELAEACRSAGMRSPLLVTDRFLAGQAMTAQALDSLKAAGLNAALFSDVKGNPVESNVEAGLKVLREGNHDGVVAFGGGSALDAGKVIAFMRGQTRPMWDFEDIGDWWTRADPNGIAPIVAVPTTAGTGSEVGRAGVITQEATHTKKVIFHPAMMPRVTILDPELTVGMPPAITAGTGLDALAHCLEAYCSPAYHPMAAGMAVEGMRLVKDNLVHAYKDGQDLEARGNMMAAASIGATAFQKGLGAIHALSHPVGALYDTHHGLTNAVFMPYVIEFNRKAVKDKLARAAAYLGLKPRYSAFLDWTMDLRERLGVPDTLKAFGVDDTRFDQMAAMAPEDPTAGGNPVPLTRAAALKLYRHAYQGKH